MHWFLVFPILLVLAGCEATQPSSDLEARAKAGDASAACDLVLKDLQRCSAARKEWLAQPGSPLPACMADPLPAQHQRHLSQATDSLSGPPERKGLLKIISDGAAITAASLKFNRGAPESMIDIIEQSCATLRH